MPSPISTDSSFVAVLTIRKSASALACSVLTPVAFNLLVRRFISQIYHSELNLNKANNSDTKAAVLDLHLSISDEIVSTKIYDERDDFDFEIVYSPFLDGDVPRSTSYEVYISQLIHFARASSFVADFNTRNKLLTQKFLKQGYWYHKLRKTFPKFYRRYYDLIYLSCARSFGT